MDRNGTIHISPKMQKIEFWKGHEADLDLNEISRSAVTVKGKAYQNPLRFMEIYGNIPQRTPNKNTTSEIIKFPDFSGDIDFDSWQTIEQIFTPHIPGVYFGIDENISQPPFSWKECDARTLGINFTYNTNALYRILSNLVEQDQISGNVLYSLLDHACSILSAVYKHRDHFIIRNINNNLNMFLISRVIELLLGKSVYNSEEQELSLTRRSLQTALEMAQVHASYETIEKMGIALGKGVSFIEKRLSTYGIAKRESGEIHDVSHQYYGSSLAIDHRRVLLDMISNIGSRKDCFLLAAILDDATETVDDFLWMQDLLIQFPFFKIHVLVNTAQVSINFSSHMLTDILHTPAFSDLAARLGAQFLVSEVYCPFISFQTTYLPVRANQVIDQADAVYVKGANFFETCQILHKDVFHAFVVYGPISCLYTGLTNYDAVFAHVPQGRAGYVHNRDHTRIVTLSDTCTE